MGVDFRSIDAGAPQPTLNGAGRRIGIAVARWNDAITTRLLRGALEQLELRGCEASDIDVHWVPGAFEIPLVAKVMAGSGRYDAVITLGCVIRGDTAHFEYVAGPAAEGVLRAQLTTEVPVIFGVLTVESREQALVRSVIEGDYEGDNKGAEAADTALEMAQVLEDFRSTN
ncbi:MAG: 6,7-dimethyl-8-ribityllumazine synthase [Microthrixaceae bacterium]|nr:6,7-dimethyl-8-ribityllumazine synthase [Microthrixaceae bacterium]